MCEGQNGDGRVEAFGKTNWCLVQRCLFRNDVKAWPPAQAPVFRAIRWYWNESECLQTTAVLYPGALSDSA